MKRLAWMLLGASILAAPGAAQNRSFADGGTAALDEYLSLAIQDTYLPGLVAMVVDRDGPIYTGAFGNRDVARASPMTADTIFRIASMTKPITSAAVMILVEEGRLGLDDPISGHMPGLLSREVFDSFDPETGSYTSRPVNGEVTVRHLLTNTSGLGYAAFNDMLYRLVGGASPPPSTVDYPLLHDPGTRWTYGESTRVLGYLVEHLAGQTLNVVLRERIFLPLGMLETSYVVPDDDRGRVVTVHAYRDGTLEETPNPQGPIEAQVRGDGNLFSTASDYALFVRMFLNGGEGGDGVRLLSDATIESMGQNHIGDNRVERMPAPNETLARPFPLGAGRDTFGLGFQVTAEHENEGMRAPGSMSWAGIYNTQFWIDPRNGIGGILLMQYWPFYDDVAIETLQGFEERVYRHLQ